MDSGDKNSLELFYIRNQDEKDDGDSDDAIDESEDKPQLEFDYATILEKLNDKHSKIQSDISAVIDKKLNSLGIWRPERNLVEIVQEKNLKQYIPYWKNNCRCLNNFEALFLLECRTLTIHYKDCLLSIEDAYQLMLQNQQELRLYKIFSTLSRMGYYVHKFDPGEEPKNDACATTNGGIKRSLDVSESGEIEAEAKKTSNPHNEPLSNVNHCVLNNIRPLELMDIPKINKVDKELIQHFNQNDHSTTNPSHVYCVKKSSRPTEIHPLIKPLYDNQKTKPLVPLGAIYNTDNLFELIQTESPKPNNDCVLDHFESCLNIDFLVYQSRKHIQHVQQQPPLFSVKVWHEDQTLPSNEVLKHLIQTQKSPLIFALLSRSLDYNFYSFENSKFKNKFPRLWEQPH